MIAELKSVVTLYERDFLHLHKWHVQKNAEPLFIKGL